MKPGSDWPPSTRPFRSNPPEGTVGIVLPIHDNLKFFKLAFHSILDFTDHRYMLTIVDNMSGFATRQYLESIRRNHLVNILQYQQTHAQGAEWNLGLRFMFAYAAVQYGVVLTPDIVVEPNWLSRLVRTLSGPEDVTWPLSNSPLAGGDAKPFCTAFKRPAYERFGGFNEVLHESGPVMSDFADRVKKAALRASCDTKVYVHHFGFTGRADPELAALDEKHLRSRQEVAA